MAPLDPIITIDVWQVLGYFYQAFLFLYIIFSLIIVRQIHLMTNTLNGAMDSFIKTFGFFHFIFAVGVFILGWIVLL